jgi:spore germination protein KB
VSDGRQRLANREQWGLTAYQVGILTFVGISGTAVLTLPQILTALAGQEAWLATLLAVPVGLVPLGLLYDLDRRHEGLTLAEHARAALGPALGGALGALWVFFLGTAVPIILREFSQLVTSEALPHTPEVVVLGLLIVVPLLMTRDGLETIVRVASVLTPIAAATLLLIFLSTLGAARLDRLLPVTAMGGVPLLQAAGPTAAFYAETALLGCVLPFRGCERRQAWLAATCGLAAAAVVLAAATLWALLIFGPLSAHMPTILFQVTRAAGVAEFISHLDALLVAVWVAGGLVKISVWFLSLALTASESLGLADYRPLTVPLAAAAVVGGQTWFESNSDMARWFTDVWPFWGLACQIGFPLLVWSATVLSDRRIHRGTRRASSLREGTEPG